VEIRSFVADELGNASYLLLAQEAGVAVAIDPMRDVGQYLEAVERMGVRLTWALETHVHNDFVSGARELRAEAGTTVGASHDAGLRHPFEPLRDGQELGVGSSRLRVLATPGHTPEHVSYLLLDEAGEPLTLFSGGALMVGTAARPDLLGPADSWQLARALGRSLRERLICPTRCAYSRPTAEAPSAPRAPAMSGKPRSGRSGRTTRSLGRPATPRSSSSRSTSVHIPPTSTACEL
jgi:hydroxyacylglutathione hydrolase